MIALHDEDSRSLVRPKGKDKRPGIDERTCGESRILVSLGRVAQPVTRSHEPSSV